jgi:hypothetical protein
MGDFVFKHDGERCMQQTRHYYEEGLDELLLLHNPTGGRPMATGQTVMLKPHDTDVTAVHEVSEIRFHLGYCSGCGRRVVIGYNRADHLAAALKKRGVDGTVDKIPALVRLAKFLLKHVDKSKKYSLT